MASSLSSERANITTLASKLSTRMRNSPVKSKVIATKINTVPRYESHSNAQKASQDDKHVQLSKDQTVLSTSSGENFLNDSGENKPINDLESAPPVKKVKLKRNDSDDVEGADSSETETSEDEEQLDSDVAAGSNFSLSEDAKELARELAAEAKAGKKPSIRSLKMFTTDALTMLLKLNKRPVYKGDKDQLVKMVQDYMVNGCPPSCPKCQKGYLRFSNWRRRYGKRHYWCPGHTPNGTHFYGCGFKAEREEITRVPWVSP